MTEDIWLQWPEWIHDQPAQITRRKSINTCTLTGNYNIRNQSAVINGKNVTPLSCSCADNQKRKLPCKHMYFLMSMLYNDINFYDYAYDQRDSWGDWDNRMHNVYAQKKRKERINNLEVESINQYFLTGRINYCDVTLRTCSCRDFQERQLPCKHIYRLAHELELL